LDVVADTLPRRVKFASVQELKGRLARLRALAKDERRFSQLRRLDIMESTGRLAPGYSAVLYDEPEP
jgi:hypothetical protein